MSVDLNENLRDNLSSIHKRPSVARRLGEGVAVFVDISPLAPGAIFVAAISESAALEFRCPSL